MMRVNLRIEGRVQGVGFRWFARELAHELGITGDVRNNDDSTVEINAQGDKVQIQRFIYCLYEGPNRFARVDHVRIREMDLVQDEKEFEVVLL